jgi:pimeloyl-ACP methyl ester carboxylesterase
MGKFTIGFMVIAMDTIGYGDSDNPPRWYAIEDYARTVIMLLDSLKVEKAVVVGHHTGSKTAVEVAVAYPERVDKLVLLGPYYWEEDARRNGIDQKGDWAEAEPKMDGSHLCICGTWTWPVKEPLWTSGTGRFWTTSRRVLTLPIGVTGLPDLIARKNGCP